MSKGKNDTGCRKKYVSEKGKFKKKRRVREVMKCEMKGNVEM